jgi:hypothetical protein
MTRRARILVVGLSLSLLPALVAQEPAPPPTASAEAKDETPAPLPDGAPEAMRFIDRADLKRHASFLASDELGGRYTGSPGQQRAAQYIAKHFESLGLAPLGDKRGSGRNYFQGYPLERSSLDAKLTKFEVAGTPFVRGWAFVPAGEGTKFTLDGELVDCGFGDPANLPKGFGRKLPVVSLRSVGGGARSTLVAGLSLNKVGAIQRELEGRGARAVLYLLDGEGGVADAISSRALMPERPLVRRSGGERNAMRELGERPALFASGACADAIRAALDGQGGKPSLSFRTALVEEERFEAVNVVAMLPGKSKEALVFSAHMDHVGLRIDGDVYNGADDNASGSSGLLDIAEAFAKGEKPERSVIFLSVSGEELGLWGSDHFAEHPTWPLEAIVADINIDMIGRLTQGAGENEIQVTPTYQHAQYSTLVRNASEVAARMGMSFTNGDQYYERSDHFNFARKGVPVVFFCNGEHPDYHKASDEVAKLDFAKLERVARLAYWTGVEVIRAKGRPERLGSRSSW